MINQFLQAASKKMMIDFEDITAKIEHLGEKGTSREELLCRYLKDYFPNKYSLSKGTIISSDFIQSKQQDIIIYDSINCPILLNLDSTKMIPIESVYAAIEVKSTLNKAELTKCAKNIQSVRNLKKNSYNINSSIYGTVFAYTSSTSIETILDNLVKINVDIPVSEQICMVCILDQGLIVNISKQGLNKVMLYPEINTTNAIIKKKDDNSLLMFYLILLQALYSTIVSPPNMLTYASKEDMLKVTFEIPKSHVSCDAFYDLDGSRIEMDNIYKLVDSQQAFKHIQSGEATIEEFIDYFKSNIEHMYKLSCSTLKEECTNINFYGTDCNFIELIRSFKNDNAKDSEYIKRRFVDYRNSFRKDD